MTRTPPVPGPFAAWFFDLDGTLISIGRSPTAVKIDGQTRRIVEELHRVTGGAIALITGRALRDVDRLFPGIRLAAAGQHGAERRTARGKVVRHPVQSKRLADARDLLIDAAARHPKLLIEDKGLSLAVHYRRAPQLGAVAHRLARTAIARLGAGYCLQAGKRIVEIRPVGKDKGTAIRAFMHESPFHGRVPVFLGDDITDEYGFAAVNRLKGHSIKIGSGSTKAHWRLRDVRAVRTWLITGRPNLRAVR